MKDSAFTWIAIALLAAIAYLGKNATMQAISFAIALVHPSAIPAHAPSNTPEAAKGLGLSQPSQPQNGPASVANEGDPTPEPYVFYLRSPIDVSSATGPHHLPTGTRVQQVSEDHFGTCTVDDGANRFTIDFAQLTQYKKVAELLRAKEVYSRPTLKVLPHAEP